MILDPTDQKIRDQGFNFVPFDRYLASPFQPKTLDMSGGISTLPVVPPILNPNINRGGDGGGGGGGITDTGPVDQGLTTADFAPDQSMTGNMGMTEEEQQAIDAYNNPVATKGMLGTAFGSVLGFMNPITAFASLAYQRNKQKQAAMEAAKEAAAKADFDRAMAQGRDFYDTLNEGRGASVSDQSREEAGTGFGDVSESGPFASGGRVEGLPVYSPSDRPAMMGGGLIDLVDIYD
tara:strand:- start:31 stop:735 length:705 start_codon:yes stop_codon:yes gene_type:complete